MNKFFGELLVEKGKLTKEQVKEALKLQKDNPERKLGEVLVTLNYIKYDDIVEILKQQYHTNGKAPVDAGEWLSQDQIDKILNSAK